MDWLNYLTVSTVKDDYLVTVDHTQSVSKYTTLSKLCTVFFIEMGVGILEITCSSICEDKQWVGKTEWCF